jgi:predicted TIM-barrel fold metal-dependent hydrolase
MNGPNVELVCALANARRTFIINHDWGSTERMVALCRQYPHACLMTGHTSPQALPATQEVPNLYIGTCPLNAYGTLERFVAEAGAERLIFGSDLLWDPIGWGIGPILYGRIPPEAKRLILGGNIRRLLGQYGAGGAS